MLRAVVLGSGLASMIPSVNAAMPVAKEPTDPARPAVMRPTELPIYEAPHAEYAEFEETKKDSKKASYVRTALQGPVRVVREQIQTVWAHTDSVKNVVHDNYNEFQDRTQYHVADERKATWMRNPHDCKLWKSLGEAYAVKQDQVDTEEKLNTYKGIVRYLREEENKQVRSGAVVMGGLTGFIFGLRGGIFRRVLYASLGTGAMGMVCFPEETKAFSKSNGALAKQYINIAYNFLYGVKPGDPQLEMHFPELSFPKDLSELVDLTASVAASVKQAVMPPPTKEPADSKVTEKNN